jgi:hypothetical protein
MEVERKEASSFFVQIMQPRTRSQHISNAFQFKKENVQIRKYILSWIKTSLLQLM